MLNDKLTAVLEQMQAPLITKILWDNFSLKVDNTTFEYPKAPPAARYVFESDSENDDSSSTSLSDDSEM